MGEKNLVTTGLCPPGYEPKGSVFLRSDHVNYGRATLVSNWNQAREAEVKDYDFNTADVRDFSLSTYHRLGSETDGSLPLTTYQELTEQLKLKKFYPEKNVHQPFLDKETVKHAIFDRNTGTPKRGYGAILPRHRPDFDKLYMETTHRTDFKPPYPYTPTEIKPEEVPDHSKAYKKCHSQFTDVADYRRPGRNTWQDETGIYANTHFKRQLIKPTGTVPNWE